MIDVDDVRLYVNQATNLSPLRMNGYNFDGVPCDHQYVTETFDRDELLYRYACQAQDSNTPDSILKLLLRWLPSDFILRHRITLDDDMTFMLAYDVYKKEELGLINSSTFTTIRRYKTRPGKFMAKIGREPSFCQTFAQEWAEAIIPLKNKLDGYAVTVLRSTEEIVEAYSNFSGELDSCLCYELDRYGTDGIHPAVVYGDESNVHMAVVSHKDHDGIERDISRTLIYDKKYVKIYPACDTSVYQITKVLLNQKGIANGETNLDGAKLNLVYTESGNVVCPYLDGKPYVQIANEVGEGIKPRKYLEVGDTGFDTTQSSYYEIAAFDPETYSVPETPNCECRNCETGVYDHDESPRYNALWDWGGYMVFCSEACMQEYGHVYAFIGQHDMGWVASEDCDHHDDEWYYDGCYEYFDLVMTDDGILQRKPECMNLGNVWYLIEDLNTELLELMCKQYPDDDYITEMYELYKSAERKEKEL